MIEPTQIINRSDLERFTVTLTTEWHRDPVDIPKTVESISGRAQRIQQLGNSVVPQIPQFIGECILNYEQVKNRREL